MTFILYGEQFGIVERAIAKSTKPREASNPNRSPQGNALAAICAEYQSASLKSSLTGAAYSMSAQRNDAMGHFRTHAVQQVVSYSTNQSLSRAASAEW
ncbi:hypothetical protein QA640_18025 [Bradyrhizobium sp. CB82]|uniref:hypothetical protein n=1 Tax=Bradyrhizobium sp. CB82 TaxID=3039159 RepID=UPI0024B0EBF7|nr:hypothetical protein [Bradyrhizobium sp. CB82]WFU44178.1 hypothetical protein QA640_18025 [Bradyrhizobium sp. CB82]